MAHRLTMFDMLQQHLEKGRLYDNAVRQHTASGEPIQALRTGKALTSAYEQLRNVTEYAEGSLTLQRAIKRFYRRTLFIVHHKTDKIGQELLIELVLGGYLQDGTFGMVAAQSLSDLATEYMDIYGQLRKAHVTQRHAIEWVLSILSVRTHDLLKPHSYDLALATFAYQYFLEKLPRDHLVLNQAEEAAYEEALYVAVHQAYLHSDIDTVRTDLIRLHNLRTDNITHYITWNTYIRDLYLSPLTLRLKRIIARNGAPFHTLRSLAETNPQADTLLPHREQFMQAYNYQLGADYRNVHKRLNSGIVKSIVFLFLTKVTIGLGVEVPFDHFMYGHVILLPLAINLLFPPLYMATLRLGLSSPSNDNAQATINFMDHLLYSETAPIPIVPKRVGRYPLIVRAMFAILFLIPFGVTFFVLQALHFNLLQIVIFLIFFSTASFLGFRLSTMIRELRMTTHGMSIFSLVRDFFYLPFILLGQWLAGKYAEVNVIGEFLDLIIELPFKTALSLIRQWIRFLSDKHDELY